MESRPKPNANVIGHNADKLKRAKQNAVVLKEKQIKKLSLRCGNCSCLDRVVTLINTKSDNKNKHIQGIDD